MTWGPIGGGGGGSTSSATYTVTDALILGAATTSGVRLDLESGELAIREGDDSAYASVRAIATSNGGYMLGSGTYGYVRNGNVLYANINSSLRMGWSSTDVYLPLAAGLSWASFGDAGNGTYDTGIARDSAGQVKVTDGSTGIGNLRATALVVGTADTSGVRLDLESGTLAVREGDDSAYAPLRCGYITFSQFGANLTTGGNNLMFAAGNCSGWTSVTSAKTTDYSVTNTDSSAVFSNEGASGAVNLTLPGASAGYHYSVAVQANQYLRLTAAAGDTIRDGGTVSAAAGYIRSTTVGSTLYLRAINATEWVVFSKTGTWTVDS